MRRERRNEARRIAEAKDAANKAEREARGVFNKKGRRKASLNSKSSKKWNKTALDLLNTRRGRSSVVQINLIFFGI